MISVADGDTPLLLDPLGSVSVSRSMSESGFVIVIRFVPFTTTRESIEENVERATDSRLVRVTVAGRSGSGFGGIGSGEVDIVGEAKIVFLRVIRIGIGGK